MVVRLSLAKATSTANRLRPTEDLEDLSIGDVQEYSEIVERPKSLKDLFAIMEPNYKDLKVLRLMLAAEMSRMHGMREVIVFRILRKHETLYQHLRVQPILDEVPGLAVFDEQQRIGMGTHGRASESMTPAESQKALSNALFANRSSDA